MPAHGQLSLWFGDRHYALKLPSDRWTNYDGRTDKEFSRTPYLATFTFNDAAAVHEPSIEHSWTKYAIDSATLRLGPATSNPSLANGYTITLFPGLSIENIEGKFFNANSDDRGAFYAPLLSDGSGTNLLAKPSNSGLYRTLKAKGPDSSQDLVCFRKQTENLSEWPMTSSPQCTFAPVTSDPVTPTPEPASLVTVGTGLLGAGLLGRRRKR